MIKRSFGRLFSPLLAVFVFFSALAAPVSAAEDPFMEVLNYDQVTDSGNFFYYTGSYDFTLSLPYSTNLYYVDLVFTSTLQPDSVSLYRNSSASYDLDIVHIGSNLYRAYGTIGGNYSNLKFTFTNSSTNYVTLLSCEVGNLIKTHFAETASAIVTVPGSNVEDILQISDTTASFSQQVKPYETFTFDFYTLGDDWMKFDYLEFYCTFVCSSITSITAQINRVNIPVEVSWLVPDTSSETPSEGVTSSNATSNYIAFFKLDLTGIDRSAFDEFVPILTVMGDTAQNGFLILNFISCTGIIEVEPLSPLAAFFQDLKTSITGNFNALSGKLSGWFSDLIFAVKGDQSAADDFQQDVVDQAGDLDHMGDVFDSVTRPMLDDVQVDVGVYVTDSDIMEVTSLAGLLLEHSFFQRMIIMSLIMATAGYALFGKR